MTNKKYREVLQWAFSFLEAAQVEVAAARYLFLGRLGWSQTDWLLRQEEMVPEKVLRQLTQDIQDFAKGQPAQYILGEADFYGRLFKVTSATLIPRPETEELVQLCLQSNLDSQRTLDVLDIGTGSGAIAITLKQERQKWNLFASDVSKEALDVARENSQRQNAVIDFRLGSLTTPFPKEKFDIIISNPPYISSSEWSEMDESVRQFEPELALFADNDGLAIYEELALKLPDKLKKEGQVYLEFGYRQGKKVADIFHEVFPDKKIKIHQDIQGHERMLSIC